MSSAKTAGKFLQTLAGTRFPTPPVWLMCPTPGPISLAWPTMVRTRSAPSSRSSAHSKTRIATITVGGPMAVEVPQPPPASANRIAAYHTAPAASGVKSGDAALRCGGKRKDAEAKYKPDKDGFYPVPVPGKWVET